jgi:UDP-GlcNAc:undecaprenyl-phosphate GlcNAc-1-phosphate transferase
MGDAGSTVLGLLLVWLFINLSQNGNAPLSPVTAGWLFGLPLIDSVSVMVRRLTHGQSPFKADRNHLHYQLLDLGFSMRSTLLLMLFIHTVMVSVGLLFNQVHAAEPILFWTFVGLVLARHFLFSLKLSQTA